MRPDPWALIFPSMNRQKTKKPLPPRTPEMSLASDAAGPSAPELPIPWPVWAITVMALAIRVVLASRLGLWLDEVSVLNVATGPIGGIISSTHSVHLLAVRLSTLLFGEGQFALRLPSIIFGSALAPMGFLVGRKIFNTRTGIIFSLFLAVGTYFINYSITATYYSHLMFWCLVALCFLARLVITSAPHNIVAFGLAAAAAFFVHPFSGLFFASFLILFLPILLSEDSYYQWLPAGGRRFNTWPKRAALMVASAAALALAIAFIAGGSVLARLSALSLSFFDRLTLGESPPDIEFSASYFGMYLRRTGPAFYELSPIPSAIENARMISLAEPLATLGAFGALILYVVGLIAAIRRARFFGAMLCFPFVVSFALVLNMESDHFFHIRYFSYLTLLFWLGIACGIDALAGLAEPRGAREDGSEEERVRGGRRFVWGQALAWGVAGLLVSCSLPQFAYLAWGAASEQGASWEHVMRQVAEQYEPGEPLVHATQAEIPMVRHFVKKYGLEPTAVRRLQFSLRRAPLTLGELQNLCYDESGLWYLAGWQRDFPESTVRWVDERFENVSSSISIVERGNDLTAYHWNWGGRYVLAPRIFRWNPPWDEESEGSEEPEGVNRADAAQFASFEEEFLFETSMIYEVRFYHDGEPLRSLPATAGIDETPLRLRPGANKEGERFLSALVDVSPGARKLAFSSNGSAVTWARMEILPRYAGDQIEIDLTRISNIFPNDFVRTERLSGTEILSLQRGTFASYKFSIEHGGRYLLTCLSRDYRNSGIILELRVDDSPIGLLAYSSASPVWEARVVSVDLERGDHELTVRFMSKSGFNRVRPKQAERRAAQVRALAFMPQPEGHNLNDQRMLAPREEPILVQLSPVKPLGTTDAWTFSFDGEIPPSIVEDIGLGHEVFAARIEPDSAGLLLVAPSQPIPEGGLIYYSALLRCAELNNHSVNLRTYFLDADGGVIDSLVVSDSPLNRTTSWVRFVEVTTAMPEAVAYAPVFWVYPNSRRPSSLPGYAYFGDLRIEAD